MAWAELYTTKERIAMIQEEIRGVKSQYNITSFELKVMESMKNLSVGSFKQNKILEQIEIKVFGRSRAHEEKSLSLKS
jgi:hypothetical protein